MKTAERNHAWNVGVSDPISLLLPRYRTNNDTSDKGGWGEQVVAGASSGWGLSSSDTGGWGEKGTRPIYTMKEIDAYDEDTG